MTTSTLIITVALLGIIIWFIDAFLPTGGKTKKTISVIVTLCVAIWVLQAYGFLQSSSHPGRPDAGPASGQLAQVK